MTAEKESMKQALRWIVGVGCVGVALVGMLHVEGQKISMVAAAQDKPVAQPTGTAIRPKSKPPVMPNVTQASQGPVGATASPEHVVYTFEDEAKMKDFALLWQKRQAMLLRMSVLKSYWEQEQEALNQINKNLSTDYHLDLSKGYTLDAQRRLILEREVPAAPSVALTPAPASTTSTTSP